MTIGTAVGVESTPIAVDVVILGAGINGAALARESAAGQTWVAPLWSENPSASSPPGSASSGSGKVVLRAALPEEA